MTDIFEGKGRRFLVVEDDYLIATYVATCLERLGLQVVGPASSVAEALALLENEGDRIDGAVLDINLGHERVYPVAEALRNSKTPFVFTTGYDAAAVPESYAEVPRCQKPVDELGLARCLSTATKVI